MLLVEDNVEILELVNLQLRDKYIIYAAQNGRAGLELARRERPDLIVTDFMMPEMDGLTMLQALRADPQFAETPIIMLTAKNQLEDRLAARQAGADIYLGKPFQPARARGGDRSSCWRSAAATCNNLMRAHVEGLEIVSGGLAHEIQNPLNFIKGAQLLIVEQVAKIREQVAGAGLTDPQRVGGHRTARSRRSSAWSRARPGGSRASRTWWRSCAATRARAIPPNRPDVGARSARSTTWPSWWRPARGRRVHGRARTCAPGSATSTASPRSSTR